LNHQKRVFSNFWLQFLAAAHILRVNCDEIAKKYTKTTFLKSGYFTAISSSSAKTVADIHRHAVHDCPGDRTAAFARQVGLLKLLLSRPRTVRQYNESKCAFGCHCLSVFMSIGLCRPVKIRRQDRDQLFADGGIFYNYPIHCYDGKL